MPYISWRGPSQCGLVLVPAGGQPVHEPGRLLGEADPHQRVQGEGGVAQPGVAVVPVPHPADALGQARGRGGHEGPGRLVGQQLQRQGRALHHLAPAALVGAVRQPALPVRDGLPEPLLRLAGAGAVAGVVAGSSGRRTKVALCPSPRVKSASTPSPSRRSGTEAASPRLSPGPSKRAPCSATEVSCRARA